MKQLAALMLGAVAVGLAATVGPWAVQLLFGTHVRLPVWVTALLGLGLGYLGFLAFQ